MGLDYTRKDSRKGTRTKSVDERANLIDSDIEKAAASLDVRYVGSTVLAKKRKY
jgi:hypothetical protein